MGGMITIGGLIAFRTLTSSFINPVTTLMQIGAQYQE
jgi:ABC-type bacteriocin/lantibiotic exporter with double-glycine peptidase domain